MLWAKAAWACSPSTMSTARPRARRESRLRDARMEIPNRSRPWTGMFHVKHPRIPPMASAVLGILELAFQLIFLFRQAALPLVRLL